MAKWKNPISKIKLHEVNYATDKTGRIIRNMADFLSYLTSNMSISPENFLQF